MTDKQKIRAEIERLKRKDVYTEYARGCNMALEGILSFIDSMPEEQLTQSVTKTSDKEEPADENFDAFERQYMKDNEAEIINIFDRHAGLVDGANWQKRQMMKEAVEVWFDEETNMFSHDQPLRNFSAKKAKLIIVKED